jgi:NAD(P)-dependent dehydrogenase (short-subunit alcohol dehydrogenase family)
LHCHGSSAAAQETADEIRARGVRAAILCADLADEDQVGSLLSAASAALGPIGVLVNNASVFERDEWHNATPEGWDAHLGPNLRAPFRLMQDFARALLATSDQQGVVVNLLDQRVWSLTPHFVSYSVSKAGLWALTQSMALALAPRIRVAAIGPGPTLPSPRQTAAEFTRQWASVPLHRATDPAEIGRAVLAILALPSFTGQMLALDGGQHLQWAPTHPAAGSDE